MTAQQLTLALAIWGAVVSTALAIRTFLQGRREDGRLQPSIWIGKVTSYESGIFPVFQFGVVNAGRRSVYLGGLFLRDRNDKYIDQVLGPHLDHGSGYIKLEPGEAHQTDPHDQYLDVDNILRARSVVAVDSLGRDVRISRWRMWRVRREIRRIRAEHEVFRHKRRQAADART
jgi:hypothetical protein